MSTPEPTESLEKAAGNTRSSLLMRVGWLALALIAEKSFLDLFVDFHRADAAHGLATALRVAQHFGLRLGASFAIALAVLVWVRDDAKLRAVSLEARSEPVRLRWLALHLALLAPMAATLYSLYGNRGVRLPLAVLGATLLLLAGASLGALLLALAPWELWRRATAAIGWRSLCAAAGIAVMGTALIVASQALWAPTTQLTFELVKRLLAPLLPTLQADAATRVLRTPRFAVVVSSMCSGLEGVGLMLAFSSMWLLYFRREYRFPRALALLPAGVLLIFALNVLRIAALVLIGSAGYPRVAVFGFHSQAGWIAFNCAACGIAFVSLRIPWLRRLPRLRGAHAAAAANPTAAYLMPLLAALAAGMLSRAMSGGFETWYPLRLLAAAIALTVYRSRLLGLDWRFSWRGIAAGVGVCALWLAASRLLLAPQGLPARLAAMSAPGRDCWIAARTAAAILILPIAEELAYRGYLMRRLVDENFEAVAFESVGWTPLLIAALACGALQGALWLPGLLAGAVYGVLAIRTGRIGEALAAHVTAGALLAVCVLHGGLWQLWLKGPP